MTDKPDALLPCLRQREVQAIGAAISTRNWHDLEQAYNSLRDKMDAALTRPQPPAATPGADGKNGTAPANPMGQPPAPYGKVHTDGSRSGGMPPGTNARPPAPQDDLVEELPQPLKDLLHHIVQCMVAEGCGEISAWESIKTIWPAITDYFAPIARARDAALAKLERAEHDLAVMAVEYPKVCDKLAAAEAALRKYGKHDHDCNKNRAARWGAGEPGCICGLRAALATEKQP